MIKDLKGIRVLVLGGSGFIGKNLCRTLVKKGSIVRCLTLNAPLDDSVLEDAQQKIEWIYGNFSDNELVKRSLRNIDVVFHLICTTLPASSNNKLQFDLSSNVLPTLNMLEAAKHSDVRKVIFISSGGTVYGMPKRVPISENHDKNPICGYGIHKLTIEKYLHLFNYLYNLDYRVLRLSNPYGKGQISDRPQGVIGNFIHKALRREPLDVWGDGKTVRDYIYIDDAIEALLSIIKYDGPFRIFNIGSGEGHSLLDVIKILKRTIGYSVDVCFHSARSVDVPLNILDISHALLELKWRPKTDIETGIRYMFEHGQQQRGT